jgi:ribosomal protein S18 acetylase RimI-like enzyme
MISISKATENDIPALVAMINAAYRGESSRRGWTTEADLLEGDLRTDPDNLAALLRRERAAMLQARDNDGELLGCVFLDRHDRGLYLGMLTVWPDKQARGIGKRLLIAAAEYAREQGIDRIYMRVLSQRDALIAWYERHGYARTGETQAFDVDFKYGVPTEPLEFVLLEMRVS